MKNILKLMALFAFVLCFAPASFKRCNWDFFNNPMEAHK